MIKIEDFENYLKYKDSLNELKKINSELEERLEDISDKLKIKNIGIDLTDKINEYGDIEKKIILNNNQLAVIQQNLFNTEFNIKDFLKKYNNLKEGFELTLNGQKYTFNLIADKIILKLI